MKSIKFLLNDNGVIAILESACVEEWTWVWMHLCTRGQTWVSLPRLQGSSCFHLSSIGITSAHPAFHIDSEVPCGWHTPYQLSHLFRSLFWLHLFRLYMQPGLTLNSLPSCLGILCVGITDSSTILAVLKSFTFPSFQTVKTIEFWGGLFVLLPYVISYETYPNRYIYFLLITN